MNWKFTREKVAISFAVSLVSGFFFAFSKEVCNTGGIVTCGPDASKGYLIFFIVLITLYVIWSLLQKKDEQQKFQ